MHLHTRSAMLSQGITMAALLRKMTSSHAPIRRKAGETMTALLRNMTQNLSRDITQINEVL